MKLRVWHIQNPPDEGDKYAVDSPEQAIITINNLAKLDLEDDDIWGNAFGLEYYDENDDDWYEWHSEEDDEDIIQIMDKQ